MSATVLYMSMSLDGYVTGPNPGPDNALGDGGERLHEWAFAGGTADNGMPLPPSGFNGDIYNESLATGAVVSGRGTAEPAGFWSGDHHNGVPIFILSRSEPGDEAKQHPLVTFVGDVEDAMAQAKDAAGDKDVMVHGADVLTRLALEAGVLDEVQVHLVPIVLGSGRSLFGDGLPPGVELELTRVLEGEGGVTHLRYRVAR